MNIIEKSELKDIIHQREMLGGESELYTCIFNNKILIYKEPYDFTEEQISTLEKISSIKNKKLTLPMHLVYDKNKFSGYLTEYLYNYLSIFYLKDINLKKRIMILKHAKDTILSMHSNNIIHLDLSPANIMCKGSKIKIIDFDDSVYNFNYKPSLLNSYARSYLKLNDLDYSVDIFLFNITTLSLIFDIPFYDILKSYTRPKIDNTLSGEKEEIWQKIKEKKRLENTDFLIDYY